MSDEEQPQSSEEMLREVAEWLGEEGGFGDQVEPIPQDAVIENTGPPKTDDEHAAGWAWQDRALSQAEEFAEDKALLLLERSGVLGEVALRSTQ